MNQRPGAGTHDGSPVLDAQRLAVARISSASDANLYGFLVTTMSAQSRVASGRAIRRIIHLAPAAVTAALMLDIVSGIGGAIAAFAVALLAPGWLLWKTLPGLGDVEPPGLPALWLVLSFTALSPVLAAAAFFGWSVLLVEWYLLAALLILGIVATVRTTSRTLAPWGRSGLGLAAVAAGAAVYRMITWQRSGDDLTYLGFIRRIAENGSFPTTNPFLSGDLPLAPRWRLDGWTGLTGVITHLGDADATIVYRDLMPPFLVVAGAAALFILARTLSGDTRFGHAAALAGLLVPLLTGVDGKTDFIYWYRLIAQNKYTALIIFLPVVTSFLIVAYRTRSRSAAVLAAILLWSAMFVHPLPTVLVVGVFGMFIALDLAVHRRPDRWAAVGLSLLMLVPLTLTAIGVSGGGRFGARLSDIADLSEIARPTRDYGPIQIWESRTFAELLAADQVEPAAILIRGHSMFGGQPRIAYLSKGLPFAHWQLLGNPANLIVLLAVGVIVLGRHRDPIALWVLGTSLTAVSVFVLPPFAAVVARFITPWQLWRFATLMPVPMATAWLAAWWLPRTRWKRPGALALATLLVVTVVASPHDLLFATRSSQPEPNVGAVVADLDGLEGTLMAREPWQSTASSVHRELDTVVYRGLATMSNAFPANRLAEAFERSQDVYRFFLSSTTAAQRVEILEEYDIDFLLMDRKTTKLVDPSLLGFEKSRDAGRLNAVYERSTADDDG